MGSWKSQEGRGPVSPCPSHPARPVMHVPGQLHISRSGIKLFDLEELSVRMQMSLKNRAKLLRIELGKVPEGNPGREK